MCESFACRKNPWCVRSNSPNFAMLKINLSMLGDVKMEANMNMPGMQMHEGATIQRSGTPGQYRAKNKPGMAGDWTAKLSYEGSRGSGQTSFNLNVKQ
jgi:hypothetical protein